MAWPTAISGTSLTYSVPAIDVVRCSAFPATIELTLFAIIHRHRGRHSLRRHLGHVIEEPLSMVPSIVRLRCSVNPVPSFWLGIMLILYVGLGLRWLPISGHVPCWIPLLKAISALRSKHSEAFTYDRCRA